MPIYYKTFTLRGKINEHCLVLPETGNMLEFGRQDADRGWLKLYEMPRPPIWEPPEGFDEITLDTALGYKIPIPVKYMMQDSFTDDKGWGRSIVFGILLTVVILSASRLMKR